MKSIASLKKKLDKVFNAYIRQRDSEDGYFVCISCGCQKPISQMHAGHFYPRTHTGTRWSELNTNGQCAHCNTFLHGNLYEYGLRLTRKIGQAEMEKLATMKNYPVKLDRTWLEERIKHYSRLTTKPND